MAKKEACVIEFVREKGTQILKIKTAEELENFFKTEDVSESKKYFDASGKPLKYYTNKTEAINVINGYRTDVMLKNLDSYGLPFEQNGSNLNFSILRTVGISEGDGISVVIQNLLQEETWQVWATQLAEFIKYIYEVGISTQRQRVIIMTEV